VATKVITVEVVVQQNVVQSVIVLVIKGAKGESGLPLTWISLIQANYDSLSQPEKDDPLIMYNIIPPIELIFTVQTDNTGPSNDDQFTVPAVGGPYSIEWDDASEDTGLSGNFTKTFAGGAGTYIGKMTSDDNTPFQPFFFSNVGDKLKLTLISQWGVNIEWTTMFRSFWGCNNLDITALDPPSFNVPNFTSLFNQTFRRCSSLTTLNMVGWSPGGSSTNHGFEFEVTSSLIDVPGIEDRDYSLTTSMTTMFRLSGLPTSRYSALLINIEANSHQSGVTLAGGSSQYSAGAAATARAALVSDGWTITDGGQA